MSIEIRQSELRNDNASVMRRVAAGESFVVTVNGRPVADVVPHRPTDGLRRFVPVADLVDALASVPVDAESWRVDLEAGSQTLGSDEPTDPFAGER